MVTTLIAVVIAASSAGEVNVRDFGAKGSGKDDTVAIQAALATGRSVYFPAGTYGVKAPLAVRPGTSWRGEGGSSVLIALPRFSGQAIVIDESGTSLAIRDLALDANGIAQHAIQTTLSNTNTYLLANIEVRGATSHGVHLVKAIGATLIGVKADHNGGDGIRLEDSNLATLVNARAVSNRGNGLTVLKGPNGFSSGVRILGGQFESNQEDGIHVLNASTVTVIADAWIEANGNDGVRVGAGSEFVPIVMRDCNVYTLANKGATNWAVRLEPGVLGAVTGNYLFNSGGGHNFVFDGTGGRVDTSGNYNGNRGETRATRFPSGSAVVVHSSDYLYEAIKLWTAADTTWTPMLVANPNSAVEVQMTWTDPGRHPQIVTTWTHFPPGPTPEPADVRWNGDTLEMRRHGSARKVIIRVTATLLDRACVPTWLQ